MQKAYSEHVLGAWKLEIDAFWASVTLPLIKRLQWSISNWRRIGLEFSRSAGRLQGRNMSSWYYLNGGHVCTDLIPIYDVSIPSHLLDDVKTGRGAKGLLKHSLAVV